MQQQGTLALLILTTLLAVQHLHSGHVQGICQDQQISFWVFLATFDLTSNSCCDGYIAIKCVHPVQRGNTELLEQPVSLAVLGHIQLQVGQQQ